MNYQPAWDQDASPEQRAAAFDADPGRGDNAPFTTPPPFLRSRPEEVFHYCRAEAAMSIISKGIVWASLSSVLNDSLEIEYGVDRMRAAVAASRYPGDDPDYAFIDAVIKRCEMYARTAPIYIASASRVPDSLSQFRAYGDYSLGIDTRAPWRYTDPMAGVTTDAPIGWYPVLYDMLDVTHAMGWFVEEVRAGYYEAYPDEPPAARDVEVPEGFMLRCRDWYIALVARMKHPAFEDEREVRCVVLANMLTKAQVRPTPRGLVPYVEFRCVEPDIYTRTALRSAHLGPGAVGFGKVGMETLLMNVGYGFSPQVPDIPYRG